MSKYGLIGGKVGKKGIEVSRNTIFLCKQPYREKHCTGCAHSVMDRGKKSKEKLTRLKNMLLGYLYRPLDYGALSLFQRATPDCFEADCGNTFFMSLEDRQRINDRFKSLCNFKPVGAAYYALCLVDMGLQDIIDPKDIEQLAGALDTGGYDTPAGLLRSAFSSGTTEGALVLKSR